MPVLSLERLAQPQRRPAITRRQVSKFRGMTFPRKVILLTKRRFFRVAFGKESRKHNHRF